MDAWYGLNAQWLMLIGDKGMTGASSGSSVLLFVCAYPFWLLPSSEFVDSDDWSSLALMSVSGGGLFCRDRPPREGLWLLEEATERSSATAVDPLELLPPLPAPLPLEEGRSPLRKAYSASRASFSVQQPCQQLRQS